VLTVFLSKQKSYICETDVANMKYDTLDKLENLIEEPSLGYLISYAQHGMPYHIFEKSADNWPFNQTEWSKLLHLSERTFQRYKKENKIFESIYTEKILELILLLNQGKSIFGSERNFYDWLNSPCLAFNNSKPISFIDNTFGITMVKNELGRIVNGIIS
jgi:putative toxin-antitoxin system antitoxin component (TIGR02293 family)